MEVPEKFVNVDAEAGRIPDFVEPFDSTMRLLQIVSFAALMSGLFSPSSLHAQDYGIEVEVVSEDIGMLVGALGITDLSGYSCSRVYITMENENDFLSSISGDANNPSYVNTTTNFYHAILGGTTPNGINSLLFPVYPDLAYDSWVTIGLEGTPNAVAGEAAVSTVASSLNPWSTNFDPGAGLPGGNIAIDDAVGGAWYALNGDANGVAGADLKVLAGQFTTTGDLSVQMYTQIFINGDGFNEYLPDGVNRPSFIWPVTAVEGCTDDTACNYNADATNDDGSCTYADAGLDCDGNCLADADGDGICDGDEIAGCTDEAANNFDPAATDDDGSCDYTCGPDWGEPNTYPSVATVLALITVDGENAAMMDAVGAFVGDELRGEGDIIEFEGATYINMTVYLAGAEEMVDFIFFNQDECSTCTIDADLTAMSFGEYGSFADPLMFDANCTATTLDVELAEGWNYVSTNVMPESYAMESLFDEALGGSLLKVLGDDAFALGGSYTPGIPSVFNSLQMHSDAAGYVIKVDADGLWSSSGEPLDAASTPLDLNEGWNIIGYVPQAAMSVEDALASIDGAVGTVIDGQNGTVWNPANPNEFNSLLDMEPGRSYWVRMLAAATLTYPEMDMDGSGMVLAPLRTEDAAQSMTGWNVTVSPFAAALAAEIRLDEAPVEGEAYIGAFDGETCVAARPVVSVDGWTGAQMAVMLEQSADIQFRLWVDGVEFTSTDMLSLSAGDELGQGGDVLPVLRFASAANAVVDAGWVDGFALAPMPAHSTTWLDLDLQSAGQARITVLDARGAEMAVLHDGQLAGGQHRIALNVTNWAAGTYFIQGTSARGFFRTPLIVQ